MTTRPTVLEVPATGLGVEVAVGLDDLVPQLRFARRESKLRRAWAERAIRRAWAAAGRAREAGEG